MLFPCGLNYTVRNESNIEGKTPPQEHLNFTSIINETRGEGIIPTSMIDSTSWDIEVSIFINFPSFKRNPVHSTSPFIVKNRREKGGAHSVRDSIRLR
jgi:hypothetical protein